MAADDSTTMLQRWLDLDRAGDPAARNELLCHCQRRVRLLTHQMLRRFPGVHKWEDTSDVMQNVLIRLDQALSAVELASVRDFLRLAAAEIRRELIDLARSIFGPKGLGTNQMPPSPGFEHAVANRPAEDADDPYRLAQWTEFHGRIAEADEDDRELFELIYYQGLSQPAAAKLLGMALTTLKRRWQAARLRLAAQLRNELPE